MYNLKLKAAICERGLLQKHVAAQAGITEIELSGFVTGKKYPTQDQKRAIAKALGMKEKDLFETTLLNK